MVDKECPDTLQVEADGQRVGQGNRAHGSVTSGRYREYCRKIAEEMGKHYGDDGHVGWQIDNECGYGQMSHDEDSRKQFREWLKKKCKTLDSLNDHWAATAYWSQTYDKARVHQDDSALLTLRVTGSRCSLLPALWDDSVSLLLDNSRFVQERVRCEL
jgi:beta-galactosidase GanA